LRAIGIAVIGQTIAHYKVTAKLGAGGMGKVYRARDETLDRDVALKVLPADALQDPVARARLLREARSAAALNHPNICTIHEIGETEGRAYIAMELVEGRPLSAHLAEGPQPAELALRYGTQIADALAHAHERQVVHRDLKGANVVVTPEGRAKVLDFGLAKRLSGSEVDEATRSQVSLSVPGAVVGTLAYMAPEQLRGEPADARSDIWALGVVLYEMVAGGRPFDARTGYELSSKILSQPLPPLPANVPVELRAVIERCLAKEPAQRYQRAGEVRAALDAIQTGTAAPWTTFRYRVARRRRATAGVALAALLAVVVVLNISRIRAMFPGGAPGIASLAVLPLENLSGDPEQAYVADGIHEALITDLSKMSGLKRVTARRAVMRYLKSEKPLAQIGRELGVEAILTGSVLRLGDRVQVAVQLVHAATEEPLWAERYERELRELPALQNEIVAALTRGLRLQLHPHEQQRLASTAGANAEAYDLYLKGRYFARLSTPEGFEKGLSFLRQAAEKDPTNARAHAELAVTYSQIGHETIPDAFDQAKAAAHKALELDPSCGEAYAVLAEIKLYSDWDDWKAAEEYFQKALAANPNLAMAHRNYAWLLHLMGRSEQAILEIKRAIELDPVSPLFQTDLGWHFWDRHEDEKAIGQARKSLEINPRFPFGFLLLALIYSEQGLSTEAIAAGQKATEANPDFRWGLGIAYARAGRRDAAYRIIEEMKRNPSAMSDWGLAQVYAVLGENEQALRWLERGFDDRFSWMPWLRQRDAGLQRPFKAFHSDARYLNLIRRMNLPE
jgi:serine/threonine-protein kinase